MVLFLHKEMPCLTHALFFLFRMTINQQTPIKSEGGAISIRLGSPFATKLGFADFAEWDGNSAATSVPTTDPTSATGESEETGGGKKKKKNKKKKKKVRTEILP